MIFLVRDIREEERDRLICQHVMGVHIDHSASSTNASLNGIPIQGLGANDDPMDSSAALYNTSEAIADHVLRIATTGFGELNVYAMKKYIQYCKMKCSPRLSEEAGNVLTSSYVKIRDDIRRQAIMAQNARGSAGAGSVHDASNTVIPITVRQLEALVRISESLSKMRIDPLVRIEDVTEALRLFQVSTMAAAQTNDPSTGGGLGTMNREELDRTESVLRSRLSLSGSYMSRQKLLEECVGQGFNAMMVAHVLHVMIGRGEVLEKNQGRLLKRIK
jgi:DNA replication licensing factor MCM5